MPIIRFPKLKVYDEGTIYRLLLGRFKTRQPMTLFKGVYPLYIDRDEEQMYCYYAGGYATRAEAERAKQQLSERGFRAPQICRWADGEMTNLTLAAEEDPSAEPVTGIRYAVQIASPEALPREVVDMIAAEGEGQGDLACRETANMSSAHTPTAPWPTDWPR